MAKKKKSGTAIDIVKIKDTVIQIEKSKNIIAAERDKLRVLYGDIEDLLVLFDEGVDEIDKGKDLLSRGIETLSEKI